MEALYSNVFAVVIWLAVYIYLAFCLMTIAGKLGVPNGWLAFIPIANVYLMCRMVPISGWYLLLVFVPIVNVIFAVYLWWKIAERRERPGWYGILMLVPIANLIIPGVLAFTEAHRLPGGATPHAR
ncbi:MAG: hypothetical protein IBX61_06395 [Thermoleophilia bacterium]|nr:hypothetical protein [Thermoleophilia bacterium]